MILGQKKLLESLENICKSDRCSHLYIFEGERGIGKNTISQYFAKRLICDTASGCGMCDSCKSFERLAHPDVILVSGTEKDEVSVVATRKLIKEVYLKPQLSKKRVFIIKNADNLSVTTQNTLLKVIEEPPEYAVFILLSENSSRLLTTILSRGVRITVPPLDRESLKGLLPNNPDDKTDFYISYCGGNPGKLLEIVSDEEFGALRDSVIGCLKYLLADRYGIYKILDVFEKYKEKRERLFSITESFFRDILFLKTENGRYIINSDKNELLNKYADKLPEDKCLEVLEIIEKTNNNMGKYANFQLVLQGMLIECWEAING